MCASPVPFFFSYLCSVLWVLLDVHTVFAPDSGTQHRNYCMIRQCAILFGCLAVGECFVHLTGLQLPSSIVGMLLLATLLELGWLKVEWVRGMTDQLISNLGFFFIPPGVALMLHFELIKADFWSITLATVLSTLLVLAVTGWVYQFVRKHL